MQWYLNNRTVIWPVIEALKNRMFCPIIETNDPITDCIFRFLGYFEYLIIYNQTYHISTTGQNGRFLKRLVIENLFWPFRKPDVRYHCNRIPSSLMNMH